MNLTLSASLTLMLTALALGSIPSASAQGDPATPSATTAIAVVKDQEPQPSSSATATATQTAPRSAQDLIARGDYLVKILGCNDCHTPLKPGPNGPEPDMSRMLSGHPEGMALSMPDPMPSMPWVMVGSATNTAFAGPWGISFATNLTPDENTGMGIWTEKMFVDALRKGRHMGVSRLIMPPMPWNAYSHLTDDDMVALLSYLKSIPPIHNRVPDYMPPVQADEPMPQ